MKNTLRMAGKRGSDNRHIPQGRNTGTRHLTNRQQNNSVWTNWQTHSMDNKTRSCYPMHEPSLFCFFLPRPFSLDHFDDYQKHFTVMNYAEGVQLKQVCLGSWLRIRVRVRRVCVCGWVGGVLLHVIHPYLSWLSLVLTIKSIRRQYVRSSVHSWVNEWACVCVCVGGVGPFNL